MQATYACRKYQCYIMLCCSIVTVNNFLHYVACAIGNLYPFQSYRDHGRVGVRPAHLEIIPADDHEPSYLTHIWVSHNKCVPHFRYSTLYYFHEAWKQQLPTSKVFWYDLPQIIHFPSGGIWAWYLRNSRQMHYPLCKVRWEALHQACAFRLCTEAM